jgi:glutamate formiminotransferase/glutamate formiminotransferase/formiminotetrahydrofolate cyclodeaminase
VALLESVPNVSEGCDPAVIEAVADAFAFDGRGRVLDIHSDPEHHRSVYTIVAEEDVLASALFAGIARAVEVIDLREHVGIHPRVGAVDVVPIVPLDAGRMPQARDVALELGRRVGDELGLPVFLYGESADGLRPAFFRNGGPAELQRRIDSGELAPSFGPATLDARTGAVLLGARPLLIAFNIELRTGDLEDAQMIAAAVRGSSGGMPGVQALGLLLPSSGVVQVSINVIDTERAPLADVVARVREEAARRRVEVGRSELVGLLPEGAVADPALLGLDALTDTHVLERRIAQG